MYTCILVKPFGSNHASFLLDSQGENRDWTGCT